MPCSFPHDISELAFVQIDLDAFLALHTKEYQTEVIIELILPFEMTRHL